MRDLLKLAAATLCASLMAPVPAQAENWVAQAQRHEVALADFVFDTGEVLPEVTMVAYTLGTPHRDAEGRIDNAVLLLHGTGGNGTSLLQPNFGDQMFGPGQPMDVTRYYVISPDNLGHGGSSKPSDDLRRAFPRYTYDDMVAAQHRLLTEGLGVERLEMLLGTSMGCMHSFVWAETWPDFSERIVSLACNAIEIAGRNRMFRQMVIDGFEGDPAYAGGNYADPAALREGQAMLRNVMQLAASNPYRLQEELPTREAVQTEMERASANPAVREPNDTIYQFDSSRDYDPSPHLSRITAPLLWINSADDFINPPGLGAPEELARQIPNARFVLLPASAETRGHSTHSWPNLWMEHLLRFLAENP